MIGLILIAALPSMLLCWSVAWIVRRRASQWGLIDEPGLHKRHEKPIPTGGGLAVWVGVTGTFAAGQIALWLMPTIDNGGSIAWLPETVAVHLPGMMQQSGMLWTMLAGGTVLVVLGLIDDRRGLPWPVRLGVQTAVAAALVAVEPQWRLSLFVDAPLAMGAVSVLWIVGLINSFNMLDNMDGLSAGVAAIAASMLAAVMLLAPDPEGGGPQLFVAGLLLVLVGALLGFLWHNRPPARLFLGDAGSYLVGYLLAMATLSATFAAFDGSVPRHAVAAPLCVLAVPLYDMVSVILIRLRAGRSPFVGDRSHFSHRLVELGMTPGQAVLTIYLATATCGLGALLLHRVDMVGACVIVLLVGCILLLVAVLETAGRGGRGK